MKDIILKRLTDNGKKTAEKSPKKSDSISIDFSKMEVQKGDKDIEAIIKSEDEFKENITHKE